MTRSNNRKPQDIAVAYLLLRMTIGLNIFIHGLSRLLMGVTVFADSLVPMFAKTFLPGWSVYAFGLVLPWVEPGSRSCQVCNRTWRRDFWSTSLL
jgi:hypothetical protein